MKENGRKRKKNGKLKITVQKKYKKGQAKHKVHEE
jgi:hypothetical protein